MLKGKVAVVTGSTSGIGLAIARAFAAEGVNVMLNGFGDAGEIESLRAGIEAEFRVKARYSGADVTDAKAVEAMIRAAESELGAVDILVNNAGIQHVDPVERFPIERWNAVLATNLSAAFFAIHVAVPLMRARKWGRIINIASAHGLVASTGKAAYVAAKHGVVGLTKVVGLETAGSGVTCNAICPGWVLTPLVQKQIDALAQRKNISVEDARIELLSEKQPSRQFVTAEDVGKLAVFLSSEAAGQITGAAYTIDGGWTAQ